jgi:hypothetical protein
MATSIKGAIVVILASALGACGAGPETPRSKEIYSVLQWQEYQLRQQDTRQPYVFSTETLKSEYNTIAFPLIGKQRGYIVFLANPKDGDPSYSVPLEEDAQFVLDKATFQEIAAKKYVTNRLQEHLRRYVVR